MPHRTRGPQLPTLQHTAQSHTRLVSALVALILCLPTAPRGLSASCSCNQPLPKSHSPSARCRAAARLRTLLQLLCTSGFGILLLFSSSTESPTASTLFRCVSRLHPLPSTILVCPSAARVLFPWLSSISQEEARLMTSPSNNPATALFFGPLLRTTIRS